MDKLKKYRQKQRIQDRKKYKTRIKLGLCPCCGKPKSPTGQLCKFHIDKKRKSAAKHYKEHKHNISKYNKEWRKRKTEQNLCSRCGIKKTIKGFRLCKSCRKIMLEHSRSFKKQVMRYYGNKCVCCGETEYVFLTIDHIYGRTNKNNLNGTELYRYIIKHNYPKSFQILCWNCNAAKSILGKCPHDKS